MVYFLEPLFAETPVSCGWKRVWDLYYSRLAKGQREKPLPLTTVTHSFNENDESEISDLAYTSRNAQARQGVGQTHRQVCQCVQHRTDCTLYTVPTTVLYNSTQYR